MFHPTPSYNHRQSCSIQYLGGKKRPPAAWVLCHDSICCMGGSNQHRCLQINGFWEAIVRYPSLRKKKKKLFCLSCRDSGSYSTPRFPCATVFDHFYKPPLGMRIDNGKLISFTKKLKGFDFIPLLSCIS